MRKAKGVLDGINGIYENLKATDFIRNSGNQEG
jgi:hypothetical protein